MSVDFVPIREEHVEGFHAALDVVSREHLYLAFLEAPPLEATREFVLRNIAAGNPQLVALVDGDVVGWCDVTPIERPTMRHCGVLGMGLIPAWRGKRVGEALARKALDASRAFGLSRVELTVRADNARAIGLYRKLGFGAEGRKRQALMVDGRYHDLIAMALLFAAGPPARDTAAGS